MRFIDFLYRCSDLVKYGGANNTAIESAEALLSLKFSEEYKEYLRAFGVASGSGYEFTGITNDRRLNVVDVTERMRLKTFVPMNLYVVEEVHVDGLVIWQNETGEVYQTLPGSAPVRVADNLSDYVID